MNIHVAITRNVLFSVTSVIINSNREEKIFFFHSWLSAGILEKWMRTLIPPLQELHASLGMSGILLFIIITIHIARKVNIPRHEGRTCRQKLRFTCCAQIYKEIFRHPQNLQ